MRYKDQKNHHIQPDRNLKRKHPQISPDFIEPSDSYTLNLKQASSLELRQKKQSTTIECFDLMQPSDNYVLNPQQASSQELLQKKQSTTIECFDLMQPFDNYVLNPQQASSQELLQKKQSTTIECFDLMQPSDSYVLKPKHTPCQEPPKKKQRTIDDYRASNYSASIYSSSLFISSDVQLSNTRLYVTNNSVLMRLINGSKNECKDKDLLPIFLEGYFKLSVIKGNITNWDTFIYLLMQVSPYHQYQIANLMISKHLPDGVKSFRNVPLDELMLQKLFNGCEKIFRILQLFTDSHAIPRREAYIGRLNHSEHIQTLYNQEGTIVTKGLDIFLIPPSPSDEPIPGVTLGICI